MKAEERKQLERNELAEKLAGVWQSMTSNSTTVTVVWSVILVGLIALIGYRYYSRSGSDTQSEMWSRLDRATDVADLEKVIADKPNSDTALVAKFHLSRFQLQDALTRIATPVNEEDRLKAADTLETVRGRYDELAKAASSEPVLAQEALLAVAKAEEALSGVPTKADPTKTRGSLDKALEAYDAVASRFPKSFIGERAAAQAKYIRENRTQVQALYTTLIDVQGKNPPAPPSPVSPVPAPPELPKAETPKPGGPALPEAPKAEAPKGN